LLLLFKLALTQKNLSQVLIYTKKICQSPLKKKIQVLFLKLKIHHKKNLKQIKLLNLAKKSLNLKILKIQMSLQGIQYKKIKYCKMQT